MQYHFSDTRVCVKYAVYIQSIEKIILGHVDKTLGRVAYNGSHNLFAHNIYVLRSLYLLVSRVTSVQTY